MEDLPNEVLESMARHLPMRSLQALACMNKRLRSIVERPIESKLKTLQQDIERFSYRSGLEDFRSLLALIRRRPKEDRPALLEALCARLDRLPTEQRKQAAAAVLADASRLPGSLVEKLKILARHGSPAGAVIDGEDVRTMNDLFGHQEPPLLFMAHIFRPDCEEGLSHEEYEEAIFAQGYEGPFHPRYREIPMRERLLAVRQGKSVDAIIEERRTQRPEGPHFDEDSLRELRWVAATGVAAEAAAAGGNIDAIVDRHGIGDDLECRNVLERSACNGAAGEAVEAGERVADVAELHGIKSPLFRLELMGKAMQGAKGDAFRNGGKTLEQVTFAEGLDLSTLANDIAARPAWKCFPLPQTYELALDALRSRSFSPAEFLRYQARGA